MSSEKNMMTSVADAPRTAIQDSTPSQSRGDWLPVKTAPKDGTIVQVRNPVMKLPVDAKWGDYTSPWGSPSKQWIVVKDHDEFWPCAPGTLVCPTEWRPL